MFTMECTEDCPGEVTSLDVSRSGKKLIFEMELTEPENDWASSELVTCIFDRGQIEKLHAQLTKWLGTPKPPVYKGKVRGNL